MRPVWRDGRTKNVRHRRTRRRARLRPFSGVVGARVRLRDSDSYATEMNRPNVRTVVFARDPVVPVFVTADVIVFDVSRGSVRSKLFIATTSMNRKSFSVVKLSAKREKRLFLQIFPAFLSSLYVRVTKKGTL